MFQFNSQEQMIYRSLAGQIQLGFYCDGERFPSVEEIAEWYEVSYCPAQRALKILEKDGLIRLCRGKETAVLTRPYEDYLKSPVFEQRVDAFIDLVQALKLMYPSICFQGLCHMNMIQDLEQPDKEGHTHQGKQLYKLFEQSVRALGNRIIMSLYYDIGAFTGSAFQDIIYAVHGKEEAGLYLEHLIESISQSMGDCSRHCYDTGKKRLEKIKDVFFEKIEQYLDGLDQEEQNKKQECFSWQPYKGRTKYCDIIAIDLYRKINQGMYPAGTLLPNGAVLADIYHVSKITIRRTIELLNQMGVTETRNGVGTSVICTEDANIPYKTTKSLNYDSFKTFLEALQLLAITGESVLQYTLPYCPAEAVDTIASAIEIKEKRVSVVAVISACLQAVVHHCPVAAIREIYGKITLLLLHGSVLQFHSSQEEMICEWPEISQALSKSLQERDESRFAAAFCRLVHDNFIIMKKRLAQMGVAGIHAVAVPVLEG